MIEAIPAILLIINRNASTGESPCKATSRVFNKVDPKLSYIGEVENTRIGRLEGASHKKAWSNGCEILLSPGEKRGIIPTLDAPEPNRPCSTADLARSLALDLLTRAAGLDQYGRSKSHKEMPQESNWGFARRGSEILPIPIEIVPTSAE